MKQIEFERWEPDAENPCKLKYAGQRTAEDVFHELEAQLDSVGYLPDDLRGEILDCSDIRSDQLCSLIFDATGEAFFSTGTYIAFSALLIVLWGVGVFFVIRRSLSIQRDPAYKRLFACLGSVEENDGHRALAPAAPAVQLSCGAALQRRVIFFLIVSPKRIPAALT